MRETYTQAEASRALDITRRTLYNWLRAAGLEVGTWPAKERTVLTRAEVELLASAHKRSILDIDALRDPLQEITDLREQIGRLEAKMLTIEGQVQTLTSLLGGRISLERKAGEQEED